MRQALLTSALILVTSSSFLYAESDIYQKRMAPKHPIYRFEMQNFPMLKSPERQPRFDPLAPKEEEKSKPKKGSHFPSYFLDKKALEEESKKEYFPGLRKENGVNSGWA